MSDEATAPAGSETVTVWSHSTAGEGPITAEQAARSLSDARRKRDAGEPEQANTQEASAETATPAQESEPAQAGEDATPPQEAHGETQEAEPEATLPPIEPPGSWTKEAKERWQSLPRDTQEYLATREQERDRELRRGQNEAAEKLKGLTAKEQAAEQERQKYEAALPSIYQYLQDAQNSDFPDIRSWDDAERVALTDPGRATAWQFRQNKIAAIASEYQQTQHRQQQEVLQKWESFKKKETQLLNEKIPELADKDKGSKLRDKAISLLKDTGFTDQELGALDNGSMVLSVHDHRFASIVVDAVKFRDEQEAKKTLKSAVAAKNLPPVQRPGAGKPANAGVSGQIKALEAQLNKASGTNAQLKIAAQLRGLRRQAAS